MTLPQPGWLASQAMPGTAELSARWRVLALPLNTEGLQRRPRGSKDGSSLRLRSARPPPQQAQGVAVLSAPKQQGSHKGIEEGGVADFQNEWHQQSRHFSEEGPAQNGASTSASSYTSVSNPQQHRANGHSLVRNGVAAMPYPLDHDALLPWHRHRGPPPRLRSGNSQQGSSNAAVVLEASFELQRHPAEVEHALLPWKGRGGHDAASDRSGRNGRSHSRNMQHADQGRPDLHLLHDDGSSSASRALRLPSPDRYRMLTRAITRAATWRALAALLERNERGAALNHINVAAALYQLSRLAEKIGSDAERREFEALGLTELLLGLTHDSLHLFRAREVANSLYALARLSYRPAPLATHQLPEALLAAALRTLRQFKEQEIVNALWGLAVLRHRPEPEAMERLLEVVRAHMPGFNTQDVANSLWALTHLQQRPPPPLLAAYGRRITTLAPLLKPVELAGSLWALAALRASPEEEVLSLLAEQYERRLPELQCHELSMGLWALASLGHTPRPELLSTACDAAIARGVAGLSHGELSSLLWALATLRHAPQVALLNAACKQISSRAREFLPRDIAQAAWALQQLSTLEPGSTSNSNSNDGPEPSSNASLRPDAALEPSLSSGVSSSAAAASSRSSETNSESSSKPTGGRKQLPASVRSALRALSQRLKLWCGAGRGAGPNAPTPAELATTVRALRTARHWPGAEVVEAVAGRVLSRWSSFSRRERADIGGDLAAMVRGHKAICPALRELRVRTRAEAAELAAEAAAAGGDPSGGGGDAGEEFLRAEPEGRERGSMDDGGSDYC